MNGKSARVVSLDRVVDANFNISDFEHRPSQVRQWFTNNIIRPMFAHLVGRADGKSVMLQATAAGVLKVASSSVAIENYSVNDAVVGFGYFSIASAATVTVDLGDIYSVIDLYSRDNELYVELDNGNGSFGDKILMRGNLNEVVSRDMVVERVRASNVVTDGSKDSKAMVIGWK